MSVRKTAQKAPEVLAKVGRLTPNTSRPAEAKPRVLTGAVDFYPCHTGLRGSIPEERSFAEYKSGAENNRCVSYHVTKSEFSSPTELQIN